MKQKLDRYFRVAIGFFALAGIAGCGQNSVTQSRPNEETRIATSAREGQSSDRSSSARHDLEDDERRGGHTLSRHVGRTDEQLEQRLRQERNISAASTWTDREIAEETVAASLQAERARIENWMRRGERRPNLALHFQAGRAIGRSLRRGDTSAVPCTSAVIVLRANGPDGFYVLTTYPEARE